MRIDKNSPLLTNYLLGEVTEAERIAVEKALQTDPELKAELEKIKPALNLAKSLNAIGEKNALTEQQRAKILNAAGAAANRVSVFNWKAWSGGILAASLALVIYFNNRSHFDNSVSKNKASQMRPSEMSDEGLGSSSKQIAQKPLPKKMQTDQVSTETDISAGGAALQIQETEPIGSLAQESELNTKDAAPAAFDSAERAVPQDLHKGKKESLDFAPPSARSASKSAVAAGAPAVERKAPIFDEKSVSENPFEFLNVEIIVPEEHKENSVAVRYFESVVKSCFVGALSRYKNYDEEFEFVRQFDAGGVVSATRNIHNSTGQNFDSNLACVLTSLKSASVENLPGSQKTQSWRLKLRKK